MIKCGRRRHAAAAIQDSEPLCTLCALCTIQAVLLQSHMHCSQRPPRSHSLLARWIVACRQTTHRRHPVHDLHGHSRASAIVVKLHLFEMRRHLHITILPRPPQSEARASLALSNAVLQPADSPVPYRPACRCRPLPNTPSA